MGLDPHTWIVRRRNVSFPKGHFIYVATRQQCPPELDLPSVGTNASTILGSAYANHFITESWDNPQANKRTVSFEFTAIPSGTFTEYEPMGYTFPPVYPTSGLTNFAGGSSARSRSVLAKVTYAFSRSPSSWESNTQVSQSATGGPFQPKSVLALAASQDYEAADGSWHKVGQWLNGYFIAQDTLNDAMDINIQGDLAYSVGASSPSASTYDGWVTAKTFIIADAAVQKWRGDIYMLITRKVRAQ